MRYYVTYCDHKYIVRCVALIQSMQRHLGHEFTLYVVCLDEAARLVLERAAFSNVKPISQSWIERYDERILMAKMTRSHREYCWTLTPTIIARILDLLPENEVLVYTDADTLYFSDDGAIFEELGDGSVLIHEHRFAEVNRADHERYGTYNVGLMVFRNDDRARSVLRWWREKCIDWCYDFVDNGRYGDQAYLNHWPTQFEGVRVLAHKGAGTAPWNQIRYLFTQRQDSSIWVDNQPLIHYHFHAMTIVAPGVYQSCYHSYPYTSDVTETVYLRYAKAMNLAISTVREKMGRQFNAGIINAMNSPKSFWPLLVSSKKLDAFGAIAEHCDFRDIGDNWSLVYVRKSEKEVNMKTTEYFVARVQHASGHSKLLMLAEFEKAAPLLRNELAPKFIRVLKTRLARDDHYPMLTQAPEIKEVVV